MFDTRVPASMHALPGRVHAMTDSADHETKPAKRTYLERLQQMRRNARNVEALQVLIDQCTDPFIRDLLVCYQNGESVEKISRASGIGPEQVRRIVKGKA